MSISHEVVFDNGDRTPTKALFARDVDGEWRFGRAEALDSAGGTSSQPIHGVFEVAGKAETPRATSGDDQAPPIDAALEAAERWHARSAGTHRQ